MRGILIVLTLIATALTFYSALWFKSVTIENDITDRVTDDLAAADAKDIAIDVDGRHVTLSGVVYDEATETAYLETANDTYGALGPIDGLTYLADGGYISAVKSADGITLRGTVPNEDARAALIAQAQSATSGTVDDQLMISGPVADWQDEAGFGLGQLAGLTSGTLAAAAGAYSLSGVADGDADAVRGAVADRDGWQAFVSAPGVTADLSNEVARLNGEVADRDTMIGDLKTQVTDLDGIKDALTGERDTLSTELADLRANLTEGQSDTESLRAELGDANDTIAGLNDQLARTGRQVTGAESLVAALTATIGDNDADVATLTAKVSTLEDELANRQVALGSTDEQVTALNATVADLTEGLATRDGEIADLSSVVAERDTTIAALNQTVADGTAKIGALEAELVTRDTTIATLGGTVDDNQAQISDLQAGLESRDITIEALRGNSADLTTQLTDLQSGVAARDTTIEALRGATTDFSGQVAGLTGQLTDRTGTIDALQSSIGDRNITIAGLNAQVADREATIDALQGTVGDRNVTIAALRNRAPDVVTMPSNAAQCAAQAAAVMEGTQINFLTASATIDAGSVAQLERLTGIALACVGDDLTVEVGGHTDNQGSDANNQTLSEARAQAVLAFMADRGVPADGLKAVGYGESQPVADNDTSAGRAQNRRISFDWQAR